MVFDDVHNPLGDRLDFPNEVRERAYAPYRLFMARERWCYEDSPCLLLFVVTKAVNLS